LFNNIPNCWWQCSKVFSSVLTPLKNKVWPVLKRRHVIQHNDTQHNDIQHDGSRYRVLLCWVSFMLRSFMLRSFMHSVAKLAFMLRFIMMIVIMLSVFIPSIVAPYKPYYDCYRWLKRCQLRSQEHNNIIKYYSCEWCL
jgi:hypothetical protein